MLPNKHIAFLALLWTLVTLLSGCSKVGDDKERITVRGWNILSSNEQNAYRVIDVATSEYDINHLELSHQIVHDLKDIKDNGRAALVNRLIAYAHEKGIKEVCLWDHALYGMDYYPDEFKVDVEGEIRLDLDNPEFWEWLKEDYRSMLAKVPEADAIMLTFIETGAHVEDQFSVKLRTEGEKLAAVVDTLAGLFIDERNLGFYIRTFIYNSSELSSLLDCIDHLSHPGIKVMVKEVPHDFFLTHPPSFIPDSIKKYPVIIEFDAAHEYNGQGIIASIFPEVHLKRWKEFMTDPNVIGYVARTDRYNDTKIIDGPCEINLYALKRAADDPLVNSESIYDEFISRKYGKEAMPAIKSAFKKSYDIITSMIYTLGIQIADHSRISYDLEWPYLGHNSGKWQKNMEYYVEHDVNRTFHYWKDVTNHLCPARFKKPGGFLSDGVSFVFDSKWLEEKELMDMEYLGYIIAEKNFSVRLAQSALKDIEDSKPYIRDAREYNILYQTFKRTEITARAFRATATAYFAYRIYSRGGEFRTPELMAILDQGLEEIQQVSAEILRYPHKGPSGQFEFESSARKAMKIYEMITKTGWEGGVYGGPVTEGLNQE